MPTITSFKNVSGPAKGVAPRGVNVDLADLHALAHHINTHPSPTKKACFTVNTFEGGEKRQELFREASGFIAIDLEGPKTEPLPEGAIEAILETLRDKNLGFVWYHTHSHLITDDKGIYKGERARVILHCSPAPTTPEEHRALVRVVMSEFPDGSFDRTCVDPARGFFYPPEEHLATHQPGRQFVWDPSIAIRPASAATRPAPPPELCCPQETLQEFSEVVRASVVMAAGNRNNPALWVIGALHCAGADEDTCRYYYEQIFDGLDDHIKLFDARYTSTTSKDPDSLKIWGDFRTAGIFSDPSNQDGLMGFLGKADGEPLKKALTPPPPITAPTPAVPTPNAFPEPKPQYNLLPNDDLDTIVTGFINEFFGRNHFRVRGGVGYFYDSTTWREADPELLLASLRDYQQKVEFQTDKGGLKRVYQKRASAQLKDLEVRLMSPSLDQTFIQESEPFEDPDYLALQNGLLHLPTLELKPFTASIRTLGTLPVSYDPEDTSTPQLDAFFESCDFGQEQRKAWLDGVGYLIFGASDVYQKAVLMVGPPRAGKGVSSALVAALVGEQNTTPISIHAFGEMFGLQSAINRKLMIVNDAEFPRGGFGGSVAGTLKQVIAGEPTSVNRKHQKVWRGPLGKLLVCSNVAPRVEGGDRALAGRWHIVEFTRSHLRQEDLTVRDRLKAEIQPIFNRLLLNWYEVQQVGSLFQPESAEDYRQETLQSSDVVEGFISEKLVKTNTQDDFVARSSVWDEFKIWQEENATHAQRIGKMAFLQQLKTSGFQVMKNVGPKKLHAFVGVKLV